MSKGTIIGLIIVIVVIIAGVVGFSIYRNSKTSSNNQVVNENESNAGVAVESNENLTDTNLTNIDNTNNVEENISTDNTNNLNETTKSNSKILVVYYSAQSHTRRVAERIAKNLNAETFELVPVNGYSEADLDWTNSNSRVSKEHNDESLRNIQLKSTNVPNWNEYDTVFIGYPIWWGIAAWPTDTFVKANDFTGKTVIPFCTSYSSGLGQSDTLLKNKSTGGDWKSGQRFFQDVDLSEVDKWINSLGL